jgi:hypothetical protein
MNKLMYAILISSVLALTSTVHIQNANAALPTSIEGLYTIKANGNTGTLNIQSVDSAGKVTGMVTFTNTPAQNIVGFYNNATEELTFMRISSITDPASNQMFTGYRFCVPKDCSSSSNTLYFAGTYLTDSISSGATAAKHAFGWEATKGFSSATP